jgi:hypothetical protein
MGWLLLLLVFFFAVWQVHPWLGIAAVVWFFLVAWAGDRS